MFDSMRRKKGTLVLFLCVVLSFGTLQGAALAQEKYPVKPIQIYVGFSPGGTFDLCARMLSSIAEEYMEGSMVVVNKPGAGGTIAVAEVAKAKPDGYTLYHTGVTTMLVAGLTTDVPYSVVDDFVPIIGHTKGEYGLCVRGDAPWSTFEEFVQYARENPGVVTVASAGVRNPGHLLTEYLAAVEGIKIQMVPFLGGAPATAALLGGHITAFAAAGTHPPLVEAGKFKLLLQYGSERLKAAPDTKTALELGYGVSIDQEYMFLAPKGTPQPILEKLEDAFTKAAESTSYVRFLGKIGLGPRYMNSSEAKEFMVREYNGWKKVLEKIGFEK